MADSVEREIRELSSLFWSERDPDGRVFAPLAEAYREAGDLGQALAVLEEGLGRHVGFAPGHVVAGRVRRARGEPDLAAAAFQSALALDDENTEALRGLAEVAVERGDGPLAADCWRRLVELEPGDAELRDRLADAERMEVAAPAPAVPEGAWGEPDRAVAELESVPDDPWGEPEHVHASEGDVSGGDELVLTADDIVVGADASAAAGELELPVVPPPAEASASPAQTEADPWASPVRATAGEGEDGPVTRTMADLYARQNLHERALRLYRQLLQRAPDDAALAERVREMEALASAGAATDIAAEPDVLPGPAEPPPPVEDLPVFAEPAAEVIAPPAEPMSEAIRPVAEPTRGAPRAPARPARRPSDDEVEALARDWAQGPGDTGELSTPFAWATRPAEPAGGVSAGGRPIGEYFRGLLDWEPGMAAPPEALESSAGEATVAEAVVAEPIVEQAVVEDAVSEDAVFDEPVAEAPVVAASVVEEPVVEEPATYRGWAADSGPAVESAAVEAPADVEPIEPALEAPADTRVIVPIESLAPDAVVPIESLAPVAAPTVPSLLRLANAAAAAAPRQPAAAAPEPAGVVPIESLAPRIVDIASLAPPKSSDDDFNRWLQRLK